ncbi:MAG: hypothetical protein AAGG56_15550 [Pseudomonadota bacterium]
MHYTVDLAVVKESRTDLSEYNNRSAQAAYPPGRRNSASAYSDPRGDRPMRPANTSNILYVVVDNSATGVVRLSPTELDRIAGGDMPGRGWSGTEH